MRAGHHSWQLGGARVRAIAQALALDLGCAA